MEMLTDDQIISIIIISGFKLYVHPKMLETMDKLRFDCFRVGNVKTYWEMEPVIRNSNLFSFDISSIANTYGRRIHFLQWFNGEERVHWCVMQDWPDVNSCIRIYPERAG